ncbi:peptide-methionine (S)-S-oxide reductase MsrA [Vibrio sp. TH_r3]|uniref:peptide-methionine (S)-S-oxide reductase MsrA n=1 Tax=Vibrio sp. TH_r3 TaxID=3082084 RepID=UPI002952FEB0|nr:peptide-methionine (S)-S-oxide reductase MsrA [Vibrio sp. TH_r3]MDV7105642.1 peptide-methionine (S)-S-oxide reductase MsrA [Vibrio sp. TH_r3]
MSAEHTKITEETAIKGRKVAISLNKPHFVNGTDLLAAPTDSQQEIIFGLGCFWGAERLFWSLDGVESTSVGYSGGYTKNPTYEEVCTGNTGHTEVVRVIFNPSKITLSQLLNHFWENHDPTQGMRQGNDIGTQYRSAIYYFNKAQLDNIKESRAIYQAALTAEHKGTITTDISAFEDYYFAEEYHQQYLAKNPEGYCGLGGTGICFPPNL